eukprot:tig00021521_g22059.t1
MPQRLRSLGLAPLANARTWTRRRATPLHAHAARGHETAVSVLLALGSDPFLQNGYGDNALFAAMRACTRGEDHGLEVVRALLRAHPSLIHVKDRRGISPLDRAVKQYWCHFLSRCSGTKFKRLEGGILALVEAGAIEWGDTAAKLLREAVEAGAMGLVRALLALPGADPAHAFPSLKPAAGTSASAGPSAFRCTDDASSPDRRPQANAPFSDVASYMRQQAAQAQHKEYDEAEGSRIACMWHVTLSVPGLDLNARDQYGCTALHYAVRTDTPTFLAVLERSTDVNAVNNEGLTPLHVLLNEDLAMRAYDYILFETLSKLFERPELNAGLADRDGNAPLYLAVRGKAKVLSKYGPDSETEKLWSDAIKTAERGAGCGGERGASPERRLQGPWGLALLRELAGACPAAAALRNVAGETPLHAHARQLREEWAGARGDLEEAARAFVAASDLLAPDAAGRTPLHVAAMGGKVGALLRAMLDSPQAAAALCAQDKFGATPSTSPAAKGTWRSRGRFSMRRGGRGRRGGAALGLRDALGLRPADVPSPP